MQQCPCSWGKTLNTEKKLIIYGAGGHGKVVADGAMQAGFSLVGFVDDAPALHGSSILELLVLGDRHWLCQTAPRTYTVMIAIGDNNIRLSITRSFSARNIDIATIISPSAVIAFSARIGRGTVIMPGVRVNADALVGEGTILNTGAIVEHDATIGHYAHVSPNNNSRGRQSRRSRSHRNRFYCASTRSDRLSQHLGCRLGCHEGYSR